jgi:hypothetical protein
MQTNSNGRKPLHPWREIGNLYHKLLYWFYSHGNRGKALKYCNRLEELLRQETADHLAILGEECWSLVFEVRGDLGKAIAYRENEIRLIKKLRRISIGTLSEKYVLDRYGPGDLSDRLDLLAILRHDSGELEEALQILRRSKRLCQSHGIPFDGADLLEEYTAEQKATLAVPHRRGA